MSRHSSRKCSLAIETPIDERAPNNPLNAFLVYNNHTNNSSNSVLLTGNDSSDSISPSTPPVSRRDDNEGILIHHHGNPPDYSPLIQKSSSLPNLQDAGTNANTTMFGNRRISICDLNNINDEIINRKKEDIFIFLKKL